MKRTIVKKRQEQKGKQTDERLRENLTLTTIRNVFLSTNNETIKSIFVLSDSFEHVN